MSEFSEVERSEIAVQFVRVADGLEEIGCAWKELESGTLPGGRCLCARLRGDPPGIYERIKQTFDELIAEQALDTSRPSLEHYRRHDEIDLVLPI